MNQFTASLWGDEAFSAILSIKSIPQIIRVIIRDTSPPLYNITEHVWFQMFGTSEAAIRSLSFVYYCLTIFFVFLIGSFFWSRRTGLLAAALTFFNPFFFVYAFEGRMYSILALGVTASMYFFLRILFSEKRISKTVVGGYVLATTWALYSHHFAIFAIFVQGIWFLLELAQGEWKRAKYLLLGFLLTGLLYLPWIWPLYKQTTMVSEGFWLGVPSKKDFTNIIFDYLARGIKHPLSKTALVLALFGLTARRWQIDIKKSSFLLTWFLGPIVVTWLVSQKFQPIFFNRYLLYAIPAIMILLASARRRKISVLALGILLGVFINIDWWYFNHPTKRPFREMASYIKETKRGDDYLINWNGAAHHLWESKYYEVFGPIYIPEGKNKLPFFVGTALMEDGDIVSAIPKKIKRVGVMTSGSVDEVSLPGYTKNGVKEFGELKFIWLQKL